MTQPYSLSVHIDPYTDDAVCGRVLAANGKILEKEDGFLGDV